MRKVALGVVAALLLAAFPLAGSASADATATVKLVNGNTLIAIDVYIDGVLVVADLPPGGSFGNFFYTVQLGNGQHSLQVCVAQAPRGVTNPGGLCANGLPLPPSAPGPVNLNLQGGANYTVVLGAGSTNVGIAGLFVGQNDISPTDYRFARITIHNALAFAGSVAPIATPIDVCVDGDKVLTGVTNGTSQQVEVEAQQQANLQIFISSAGCVGPASVVNLVAGTNLVLVLSSQTFPACTSDCGQVIFVGEESHPNVSNVSAFCAVIPQLATIQGEFKDTLGGVDPSDHFTFPSAGSVKKFADDVTLAVTTGDFVVPNDIKPQWEVISAGLRQLVQTLQLVNYDVSGLPTEALQEIVEASNKFKLPGVPTPDLDGAVAALTAWFKANCAPAATPTAPAATPAAAGPKFTG